jgi:hypothetical protein
MKRLTFLFSIIVILIVSCLIASPALALTVTVRARGAAGTEQIRLYVNSYIVQIWTITTTMADYTATTSYSGNCRVRYYNDGIDPTDNNNVQVDYIILDSAVILQAEDQAVNTGVWQNDQCGGSYSEWLNCSGWIDFVNPYSLSVSPSSLSVSAIADSNGIFDITSNTTWTVSSNQSWLTTDPASGSNNETITVTAQENMSLTPRMATVTVSGASVPPKTIIVTQDPILSVSLTWLIVAAEPNIARTLNISSSTSWTISSDQTWLTVDPNTGSGNGTVTLTAEENTAPSTRTATVTVSVTGVSQNVAVMQMNTIGGDCNVIPPMPPFSVLVDNPKFPDPFIFMDGTRMTTKDQWKCRRAEIAALVQEFELGYMQYTPYSATTGSFSSNTLTVYVHDNDKDINFACPITYPSAGSPPYPAMIGCGFSSLNNSVLSSLGVAVITLPNSTIAQQTDGSSRGKGRFYDMYGSGHSAGALMAWAWGADRLMDALEKTPAANIDPRRLGVTGCSRNGKGALIIGAFCDRIKLTIPQESGSGGAASWRVSEYQKDVLGQNVQTICQIVTENVWLRQNFSQFCGVENKLPFDHHMVAGLCAPDALLFIENSAMEWLGNVSTWTNGNVSHKIWQALEMPDKMGYSSVGHGDHCVFPASQQPAVTAYVQKFLVGGGTADTSVMTCDGGVIYNEAQWVDWTVPDLQLLGDFVSPDGVDFIDFAILANAWLSDPMQPNWDEQVDISQPPDDVIDIFDLDIFTQNWLEGLNTRRP